MAGKNPARNYAIEYVTGTTQDVETIVATAIAAAAEPTGDPLGEVVDETDVTAPAHTLYDNGPTGAALEVDWSNGDVQQLTLSAATVALTFAGVALTPQFLRLEVYQDLTGGRLIDWSGIPVVWPDGVEPTLLADPTALTVIDFQADDAGASFLGSYRTEHLDDLVDVDLSTPPTDGQALIWDDAAGRWVAGDASSVAALDDLTDVVISSPAVGDRLRYDGSGWFNSAKRWVPMTIDPAADGSWQLLFTDDGDVYMMEAE